MWKKVLLCNESMQLAGGENWQSGLMSTSALSNDCYVISNSFSCTVWNGNCVELNGVKWTKKTDTWERPKKGKSCGLIGNIKWLMQNQGKLTWRMKVTRVTGIIWTCKGNDGVNKIKQNKFVKKKKKRKEMDAWYNFKKH